MVFCLILCGALDLHPALSLAASVLWRHIMKSYIYLSGAFSRRAHLLPVKLSYTDLSFPRLRPIQPYIATMVESEVDQSENEPNLGSRRLSTACKRNVNVDESKYYQPSIYSF
jgi:hypothetical protein